MIKKYCVVCVIFLLGSVAVCWEGDSLLYVSRLYKLALYEWCYFFLHIHVHVQQCNAQSVHICTCLVDVK